MGALGSEKPRVEALTGGARSGKTEALVARVAALLADCVAAADILVLTPGRDGAQALAGRLAAALGPQAAGVRVRSLRSLALDAVRSEEARARLGYAPRVLLGVEKSLVEADAVAAGGAGADVRRATRALCAAWAQGGDPRTLGDAAVDDLLDRFAARAALPVEGLAACALGCVRADACLATRIGAAHVLVDDAHALSPAAVSLACALAGQDCLLAGDPSWAPTLFDPGARANAFVEAAGERVSDLPPASRVLHAATAYAVKWGRPEGEQAGCRTYVSRLFAKLEAQAGTVGLAEHDTRTKEDFLELKGSDVAVVAPNRAWATAFAAKLAEKRIPSTQLLAAAPLAGDPAKARANAGMRAFALLGLLACPEDVASWRLWCALGRPDQGRGAWVALERAAREAGTGVLETLAGVRPGAFEGADTLAEAYAQGRAFVEANARKRGHAVCKAVNPQANPEFAELCVPVEGDETPAALFARVHDNAVDRHFDEDARKVRIGCAEAFTGLGARYVVALGFNEGLVPAADRAKAPEAFEAQVAANLHALGMADEELVVSYVQRCLPEVAQKMGATALRTRREEGVEYAVLRPSPCLARLGAEVPSTLSGQQFCSVVLDMRV